MTEQRVPIADVLGGMAIHALEPGATPLEAFLLIKLLDPEGEPTWSFRTTNELNLEELLGALLVQVEVLKKRLVDAWD